MRIGPIKFFLDGGMLNGTAYMRQPWPKGETYQIIEDDYRGLLFMPPDRCKMVVEEAAKRKWQVTAHTAGEGAMDVLLDAYEFVNRTTPIKDLRFCITHANFPSQHNLERCQRARRLCRRAAGLAVQGRRHAAQASSARSASAGSSPYKSWLKYTTIGGGSDHMIKLDSLEVDQPVEPLARHGDGARRGTTERGADLVRDERLTREQALRLYTINNAYLNHEEKGKGAWKPASSPT